MPTAMDIQLYNARQRRRSLLDPSFGLNRTHRFMPGDAIAIAQFSNRLRPIAFAIDYQLDAVGPNGCLFEIGDATAGAILWVDSALGTMGFAAGASAGDNGVSGTIPLNHLSATAAVVSAGGSGYAVGDLITLAGGTFSRATVLRVATLNVTAVATVTVQNGGVYSVAPTNPVAQGSTTGTGINATFTMTYALKAPRPCRVVCAVIPNNGTIRMWVDGHRRIAAASVAGTMGANGWGTTGAGAVGNIAVDCNTRAPAGARVAVANLRVVSPLSVFDGQRPRQYYTGKLGL